MIPYIPKKFSIVVHYCNGTALWEWQLPTFQTILSDMIERHQGLKWTNQTMYVQYIYIYIYMIYKMNYTEYYTVVNNCDFYGTFFKMYQQ